MILSGSLTLFDILAATYGQGAYGSCKYQTDCPSGILGGLIPITGSGLWLLAAIAAFSISLGIWVWVRQHRRARLNQPPLN